jgi:hypothetical protein
MRIPDLVNLFSCFVFPCFLLCILLRLKCTVNSKIICDFCHQSINFIDHLAVLHYNSFIPKFEESNKCQIDENRDLKTTNYPSNYLVSRCRPKSTIISFTCPVSIVHAESCTDFCYFDLKVFKANMESFKGIQGRFSRQIRVHLNSNDDSDCFDYL